MYTRSETQVGIWSLSGNSLTIETISLTRHRLHQRIKHTYIHTCTHVHIYIYTHIHTHTHIHTNTYTHTHTCQWNEQWMECNIALSLSLSNPVHDWWGEWTNCQYASPGDTSPVNGKAGNSYRGRSLPDQFAVATSVDLCCHCVEETTSNRPIWAREENKCIFKYA